MSSLFTDHDREVLGEYAPRVSCPECDAKEGEPCVFQVRTRKNRPYHVRRYQEASCLRNKEIGKGRRDRAIVYDEDPLSSRSVSNYELRKAGCYRVRTEEEAKEESGQT